MDGQLLSILRCPETGQPLRPATEAERHKAGLKDPEALIREDGLAIYPVRNGIPLFVRETSAGQN